MSKIKYALIGCGRISPNHIEAAFNNIDDLEIAALCDIENENIEHVLEVTSHQNYNVKKYTDYKKMITDEKPQLVAIATPSGLHAQIALYCIEHGCNVIIEKPISLSMKDARMLIEAAKKNNVKICACHQNRFNKSIAQVRTAVENGRFGKMLHGTAHILWNRGKQYYEQAKWRGTWEQDGGALMNQCIHNIDLLRWMMGDDIEEVFAYTDRLKHDYISAEDLGVAVVKFKNGSYGMIEGTTNVYPSNLEETLYLFGENATVKVGGKSVNIIENWKFADNLDDEKEVMEKYKDNPPNVYGFGHTPLYADVIDAVKNNREPYVSGEAGARALELVLAIYLSASTGKPVKLPLDNVATTDFISRFDN